jgi:hypothetical protein
MLSIVVTWRDRVELARSLPSLLETAALAHGDLTVVNFSGSPALLREQIASAARAPNVVEVVGEPYFNKSAAQNIGAFSTCQRVLFFCDCDIVLDPVQVAALAARVDQSPGVFATLAGVRESEENSRGGNHVVSFGYQLDIRTADGRRLRIVDNEEDIESGTRQAPGLLIVRRQDFLSIDGYNGTLHGWGWEDQDMISRLTLGAGLERIIEGTAIHLSHGDAARTAFYPEVASRWESRDRMFRTALSNYDAANFRGTYSADVARLGGAVKSQREAPAWQPA